MDLQTRDIGQDDYDDLLILDEAVPKKTVPKDIIEALPMIPFAEVDKNNF